MTLNDSHCHLLSPRFYETVGRERYGADAPVTADRIAAELGWEPPGSPEALADRWAVELDRNHVTRAALIASVGGDEASVAAAVGRHPRRFVGFFVVNPAAADPAAARRAFGDLGLRCACLFPAMHRYRFDEDTVTGVFEAAASHGGAIFAHCGYLSMEARTKLGLPSAFDLRCGDPLALAVVAARFPGVPVIVPSFGAGFLREALMAAESCPNIHFDTSSSNGWIKYFPGLTLAEVFRRALAIAGPDRILFGTDSSYFPRGWRRVIHGAQQSVLDELGIEQSVVEKIFGGNFDRLFPV
jgi:uncharacterized protein